MFIKTNTLGIFLASVLVTGCAGNNIKQQEINSDKQKSVSQLEVTQKAEVAVSDFSTDISSNNLETKPVITEAQNEIQSQETTNSKIPTIKIVNFNFDKFKVSDENQVLLKRHADFLIANPAYVLSVNGHSDYRGPEVYNEKLSLRRANSVATLLISYGAPESQLIINSFGASQPVENFDNWFQNRRVELEYSELYMVSK